MAYNLCRKSISLYTLPETLRRIVRIRFAYPIPRLKYLRGVNILVSVWIPNFDGTIIVKRWKPELLKDCLLYRLWYPYYGV